MAGPRQNIWTWRTTPPVPRAQHALLAAIGMVLLMFMSAPLWTRYGDNAQLVAAGLSAVVSGVVVRLWMERAT